MSSVAFDQTTKTYTIDDAAFISRKEDRRKPPASAIQAKRPVYQPDRRQKDGMPRH